MQYRGAERSQKKAGDELVRSRLEALRCMRRESGFRSHYAFTGVLALTIGDPDVVEGSAVMVDCSLGCKRQSSISAQRPTDTKIAKNRASEAICLRATVCDPVIL